MSKRGDIFHSLLVLLLMAAVGHAQPADAAEFLTISRSAAPGYADLEIKGPIEAGDTARFRAVIDMALQAHLRLRVLQLNSSGGRVKEASEIAKIVSHEDLDTVVRRDATCASACVIIYFAGIKHVAEAGSLVGVHWASHPDGSTRLDGSVLMAHQLQQYCASETVIRKLLATAPDAITWLDQDDTNGRAETPAPPAPKAGDVLVHRCTGKTLGTATGHVAARPDGVSFYLVRRLGRGDYNWVAADNVRAP